MPPPLNKYLEELLQSHQTPISHVTIVDDNAHLSQESHTRVALSSGPQSISSKTRISRWSSSSPSIGGTSKENRKTRNGANNATLNTIPAPHPLASVRSVSASPKTSTRSPENQIKKKPQRSSSVGAPSLPVRVPFGPASSISTSISAESLASETSPPFKISSHQSRQRDRQSSRRSQLQEILDLISSTADPANASSDCSKSPRKEPEDASLRHALGPMAGERDSSSFRMRNALGSMAPTTVQRRITSLALNNGSDRSSSSTALKIPVRKASLPRSRSYQETTGGRGAHYGEVKSDFKPF
jgi:hypothetical protein